MTQPGDELWAVRFARLVRVDDLVERLPFYVWPPAVLVLLVFLLSRLVSVFDGVGREGFVWMWGSLLTLAALVLVVMGVYVLARGYLRVVDDLPDGSGRPEVERAERSWLDGFLEMVDGSVLVAAWRDPSSGSWKGSPAPPRVRAVLLMAALGLHAVYLFVLGNVSDVFATHGVVLGFLDFFVLVPFVYYPLVAEFVAVLVNVFVVLPSRVRFDRLLDPEDPVGFWGMRPLGRLVKTATLFYVAGTVLYTLRMLPYLVFGELDPTARALDLLYVGVAVVVGVVFFLYPVLSIGRMIALSKEEMLLEIADRVERTGDDVDVFPRTSTEEPEVAASYMQEYINMKTVKEAHDYPVNSRQVLSVFSAFVLPIVLNYVSALITS